MDFVKERGLTDARWQEVMGLLDEAGKMAGELAATAAAGVNWGMRQAIEDLATKLGTIHVRAQKVVRAFGGQSQEVQALYTQYDQAAAQASSILDRGLEFGELTQGEAQKVQAAIGQAKVAFENLYPAVATVGDVRGPDEDISSFAAADVTAPAFSQDAVFYTIRGGRAMEGVEGTLAEELATLEAARDLLNALAYRAGGMVRTQLMQVSDQLAYAQKPLQDAYSRMGARGDWRKGPRPRMPGPGDAGAVQALRSLLQNQATRLSDRARSLGQGVGGFMAKASEVIVRALPGLQTIEQEMRR